MVTPGWREGRWRGCYSLRNEDGWFSLAMCPPETGAGGVVGLLERQMQGRSFGSPCTFSVTLLTQADLAT